MWKFLAARRGLAAKLNMTLVCAISACTRTFLGWITRFTTSSEARTIDFFVREVVAKSSLDPIMWDGTYELLTVLRTMGEEVVVSAKEWSTKPRLLIPEKSIEMSMDQGLRRLDFV
jgi:hypothetical protein